jgi:hypothetical protein
MTIDLSQCPLKFRQAFEKSIEERFLAEGQKSDHWAKLAKGVDVASASDISVLRTDGRKFRQAFKKSIEERFSRYVKSDKITKQATVFG